MNNFVNWKCYHDNKLINEYNLKNTDTIKLFNTNDLMLQEDNINNLNRYYSELCMLYYIWKNQKKSEYICISHYKRDFTDIDFEKLSNNSVQVYYKWKEPKTVKIDNLFDLFIDPKRFWTNKLIEYINIQNIYSKNDTDKLKYSISDYKTAVIVFACNWKIFNEICSFMFGFFEYCFPNNAWKNPNIILKTRDEQHKLYIRKYGYNEPWNMYEQTRYFSWIGEYLFILLTSVLYNTHTTNII